MAAEQLPASARGRRRFVSPANCRAPCYALVFIPTHCARCGCAARAAAYWLPPGHELIDDTGDDRADEWELSCASRLLHRVIWVDPAARRWLRMQSPGLRPVADAGCAAGWWANHCDHCASPIIHLDLDPVLIGAAFDGLTGRRAAVVVPVVEPLRVHALAWSMGDLADATMAALEDAAARDDGRPLGP